MLLTFCWAHLEVHVQEKKQQKLIWMKYLFKGNNKNITFTAICTKYTGKCFISGAYFHRLWAAGVPLHTAKGFHYTHIWILLFKQLLWIFGWTPTQRSSCQTSALIYKCIFFQCVSYCLPLHCWKSVHCLSLSHIQEFIILKSKITSCFTVVFISVWRRSA